MADQQSHHRFEGKTESHRANDTTNNHASLKASLEAYQPNASIRVGNGDRHAVNDAFGAFELFEGNKVVASTHDARHQGNQQHQQQQQHHHETRTASGGFGTWRNGLALPQEQHVQRPAQQQYHNSGSFGTWRGGMAQPSAENVSLGHTFQRTLGTSMQWGHYASREK